MALIEILLKILSKIVNKLTQKRSQNRPKWGPDGLWSPLGGRERFQTRFPFENPGHFGTKIGPKLVQNRPKIEKLPIPKPALISIKLSYRF